MTDCKCQHPATDHGTNTDYSCRIKDCPCSKYQGPEGAYGYQWDNPFFVAAADRAVEACNEDAEKFEEFMRAMAKTMREKSE
jgi:hypothetical protein